MNDMKLHTASGRNERRPPRTVQEGQGRRAVELLLQRSLEAALAANGDNSNSTRTTAGSQNVSR